ncbi:hypothetical protein HDU85_004829 [Gaertneriomyces sp. JEL0708]|nr:hypothetical protein HDU85_004829 [Gaertneriomyces sp. JEL0708]
MKVNLKRRGKAVVRVPSSSGAAVDLETTMDEDGSLRRIQVKSRKGEVEKMIEGNIKHSSMPSYTPQIAFPAHLVDSHIDATKLPNPLPPAPPKIDATDPLALGIHYHEAGNLVLSAYYLSISAALGHPVGCYLYAMALRHGWGCRQDTVAAVALFELAAEYVIQMLPTVGKVEPKSAGEWIEVEVKSVKGLVLGSPESAEAHTPIEVVPPVPPVPDLSKQIASHSTEMTEYFPPADSLALEAVIEKSDEDDTQSEESGPKSFDSMDAAARKDFQTEWWTLDRALGRRPSRKLRRVTSSPASLTRPKHRRLHRRTSVHHDVAADGADDSSATTTPPSIESEPVEAASHSLTRPVSIASPVADGRVCTTPVNEPTTTGSTSATSGARKRNRFSLSFLPALRRLSTGITLTNVPPAINMPPTPSTPLMNSASPPTPLTTHLHSQSQYRHTSLRFTRSFLPLPLYQLATCYHQGWGLPKSLSTALYYFQLAAQLGDTDAQEMCARMYIRGEGVKRDRKIAAKWLRECAKGGGRVVGESWIWKEKWGGSECDTASQANAEEGTAIGKKASLSAESKSSKGRWRGKSISGRTVNTRNSKASAQTMTTTNTFISQSSSATLIPSH